MPHLQPAIINILAQVAMFVIINQPTLIHHYYSKTIFQVSLLVMLFQGYLQVIQHTSFIIRQISFIVPCKFPGLPVVYLLPFKPMAITVSFFLSLKIYLFFLSQKYIEKESEGDRDRWIFHMLAHSANGCNRALPKIT